MIKTLLKGRPTEWEMDEDGTNLVGRSVLLQVPVDVADGSSEEKDDDDCGANRVRYWPPCGVHEIQASHPMTSVNSESQLCYHKGEQ